MALSYGQPQNYPSPLIPIPSSVRAEPLEGRMTIPAELVWNTMGGAGKVIGFDLREGDLTQIRSLIVDNSECAVAVTLIFPDTSEKLVIPANAKRVAVPIYTNGLNFVASAATAGAADITRIQILNYLIPPAYIP
jgi:hypothetical protein